MIKIETNKMQKAIERAKAVRPRVTVINASERIYSVTGSKGDRYTVKFAVANGHKLGECNCIAGQRGMVCYHLAAAAQANVMVQSMRQQAAPAPAPPRIVRRIERGHNGAKIVAVYCDGWSI